MTLKRKDLVYPELCYKVVGIAFDVYNTLGIGQREKYYERALAEGFKQAGIKFQEQVYLPLEYKQRKVGSYYLDFLVENKLIVEIKKGDYFAVTNIKQISEYLKSTKHKLGILINFTNSGVKFKRILNINQS